MRRLLLLMVMLVASACGRDAADVRFADTPAPGGAVPGWVAGSLPTARETASAEPASPSPEASTPAAVAEPVTPGPSVPEPRPTPTSSSGGPRELGQDEDAEIGRRYRFNLYTHCGITTTWFDGHWWNADPPQSDGSGNPPPGWGNPHQPGVIVLTAEDHLSFTGDEGQRADFVPRPAEQGEPPPCM